MPLRSLSPDSDYSIEVKDNNQKNESKDEFPSLSIDPQAEPTTSATMESSKPSDINDRWLLSPGFKLKSNLFKKKSAIDVGGRDIGFGPRIGKRNSLGLDSLRTESVLSGIEIEDSMLGSDFFDAATDQDFEEIDRMDACDKFQLPLERHNSNIPRGSLRRLSTTARQAPILEA